MTRWDKHTELIIRGLTEADIAHADIVVRSAFGTPESRRAELRRYLALQPDGWLLAVSDGTPVGMVGAVDYGPFAYVGLLAVHPLAQRRGVGAALMRRLVAWLDARGTPMALLDATEAGAPIYARLGFVEVDRTDVYQVTLPPCAATRPSGVRLLGSEDVQALNDFDTPIFGAHRAAVFNALLTEFPGRAFGVWDEAGKVSGYLIAQARRVGPWVAARPQDAEALLQAALSLPYDTAPTVLVPGTNAMALSLLERAGAQPVRFCRHMQRGGSRHPIRRELICGLASFALG